MTFPRAHFFGFDFSVAPSVAEVADAVIETATGNEAAVHFVVTPNAAQVVYYHEAEHAPLLRFYASSGFVLADGAPVAATGRALGHATVRLAGSDLFPAVWQAAKFRQLPVYMVASSDALAAAAQADYSSIQVSVPPFFAASDKEYIKKYSVTLAAEIIAGESRLVFLGLGFPKQEKLGMVLQEELVRQGLQHPVTVLLLGASYEFYFGLKNRAPAIWQRLGLEWLYRFAQEPRRLWKRYTSDNVRFLRMMRREIRQQKSAR